MMWSSGVAMRFGLVRLESPRDLGGQPVGRAVRGPSYDVPA